jgi:hypothetical protein
MGNTDAALAMMILTQFWDVILVAVLRGAGAYLVLGIAAGLWYALPVRGLLCRCRNGCSRPVQSLAVMCWTLLSVLVLFCAADSLPPALRGQFCGQGSCARVFSAPAFRLMSPYIFYALFLFLQLPAVVALAARMPAWWSLLRRHLAGRRRALVPGTGSVCLAARGCLGIACTVHSRCGARSKEHSDYCVRCRASRPFQLQWICRPTPALTGWRRRACSFAVS